MAAESNAHKDSIGPCLICNELSFGKHYGCVSCLGCKTFFRRGMRAPSPSKNSKDTVCKKPNECQMETSARRLCRSCRFRRCLEMGMSKEALQPRRDLIGRRKRRAIQSKQFQQICASSLPSTSSAGSEVTPPIKHLKNGLNLGDDSILLELISSLAATDKAIRARKFELIRARTEAKRLADVASKGSQIVQSQDTMMKIVLSSDLCNVTQIEIFSMFEWVQTIPAFCSLPMADRMLLLKRFAMPSNIIEYGYFTAQIGLDDVWLISNGTCMPRSVNVLPDESKTLISEDRKWRQEKLYKQMTDRCIDEVVAPLRRLQLYPEELVTLKILLLFSCGNHTQHEESAAFISDESRRMALKWKNRVISALFQFYKSIGHKSSAERFGNVVLLISGIVSAASATLESYQIMRLFKFATFDHISEQLLFDTNG